ncbi:hypothetical protein [Aggregatilinea lenta]|uniref:hypothetical protein n=1 Tax=Aggregatilinea lenta TaxID=913108 RepID=UPI0013C2D0FC|nr:hypothetical protein [Aggregatilinea lenta]
MRPTRVREPRRALRGISVLGVLLGLAVGIGLALVYTWEVDPVIERNTAPWQLSDSAREDYVVAVAMSYADNHDLQLAFDRLRQLRPDQDVWTVVAQIACERHKRVQVKTNSDVMVMRALEQLYRPQGASGCADGQYPTPAPVNFVTQAPSPFPTPTLMPPATKTPTPVLVTSAPETAFAPTSTLSFSGSYVVARINPFCDSDVNGVIQVSVYDNNGQGIAGVPVRVTWDGDQTDQFYTGLAPDEGPEYGDFVMTGGRTYTVAVASEDSDSQTVEAVPCGSDSSLITSYQISFRREN